MARRRGVSRRRILKTAGAAAIGGGAALLGSETLQAQGSAPAVLTNNQGGRRFRAFVKYGTNVPSVETLVVRPLSGRQVLMRTEAAQTCYTSVDQVLVPGIPINQATIVGHGGVGIVEAVGPQVISTRVGDRVIVNLHAACGRCFNCLRGRSDKCMNGGAANPGPSCDMGNTPVFSYTGAMSDLMITNEEYVTPLFTDVPAAQIAMLTCVGGCGLGMTMTNCPVDVASDVVIFGAGPVGLSAVQGAKIKGASRIIVVEPIRYRREIALKLGATDVVDPNQYRERTRIQGAARERGPIPRQPRRAPSRHVQDEDGSAMGGRRPNRPRSHHRSRRRRQASAESRTGTRPDRPAAAAAMLGARIASRDAGDVQRRSPGGRDGADLGVAMG